MKKTFHHGTLKSPRLANMHRLLKNSAGLGCTTMEMALLASSTRPSSDIAELRANGIIIYTKYEGKTETGRKIYRYTLA